MGSVGKSNDSSPIPRIDKEEDQGMEERSNVQFPWKLHELLNEAEANGNDSIVSWLPGTDAFKVHNKTLFASKILPKYFNATKYKSFQRNLNLWGFETITEGPNKGGCYHRLFLRGEPAKCHYMTRQKVKKGEATAVTSAVSRRMSLEDSVSATSVNKSFAALAEFATQAATKATAEKQGGEQIPFPRKLHFVLASGKHDDCLTWTTDGRCIRVVDPFRFQEKVAAIHFGCASYTSFLVELERFGFKKITHEGHPECFYHDVRFFLFSGFPVSFLFNASQNLLL